MANYGGKSTQVIDREAQAHNAQINDMYALLRDTESEQLERLWAEAKLGARNSVAAPEQTSNTATVEHTPVRSDLFTPSTLDRTLERGARVQPQSTVAPAVTISAPRQEAVSFSLTSAAKKAIAIFASAAMVMLTAISVNTQWINNREMEIARLEARNASVREEIAQIQSDIEYYSSEEVILQWAAENNFIQK